jgi:AcrR family transcriptional regulator
LTPETLRADAARNRQKVLEAAGQAFADEGTNASLEAIAKRAGVGIGTLYRHFPSRDALVEAAYRNEVAQLAAAAGELLADHPADVALWEWMQRFIAYVATKRGMADALQSVVASNSELFAESKQQMVAAVTELVDAGRSTGRIRADAQAEDILHAMSVVKTIDDPRQAERVLELLLDGLRYGTSPRSASREPRAAG